MDKAYTDPDRIGGGLKAPSGTPDSGYPPLFMI